MSDPTAPDKSDYGTLYASYHRNVLILCLIVIGIKIGGVVLDFDKIFFISSHNEILDRWVPVFCVVCAIYLFTHFVAEWLYKALPHYEQSRDQYIELAKIFAEYNLQTGSLNKAVPDAINDVRGDIAGIANVEVSSLMAPLAKQAAVDIQNIHLTTIGDISQAVRAFRQRVTEVRVWKIRADTIGSEALEHEVDRLITEISAIEQDIEAYNSQLDSQFSEGGHATQALSEQITHYYKSLDVVAEDARLRLSRIEQEVEKVKRIGAQIDRKKRSLDRRSRLLKFFTFYKSMVGGISIVIILLFFSVLLVLPDVWSLI